MKRYDRKLFLIFVVLIFKKNRQYILGQKGTEKISHKHQKNSQETKSSRYFGKNLVFIETIDQYEFS
ncbi:hypothetical protein CSB09_00445 [Candidatus Gracilibacteria bacterium]|nr:MAG: hypothetical protein CSB09_00445 [Candidatus Gracilibacteria bacterium]